MPSAPVMVESTAAVPSFVNVTLAPRMGAPEASDTVPKTEPVSTGAWRGCALMNTNIARAIVAEEDRKVPPEMDFRFMSVPPQSLCNNAQQFLRALSL